jgi:uncharacterized protein YbjT (DUF2867 family)
MNLIVGASGGVGGEVARGLVAAGERVRVLTRDAVRVRKLLGKRIEVVADPPENPAGYRDALRGVECVFLLALPQPRQAEHHCALVGAAAAAGVKRLVCMSALEARADAPSALLRWPGQIEAAVRDSGIPFTVLQPNLFMQSLFLFAPSIAGEGMFSASSKGARIGLVDARDVAEAVLCAGRGDAHLGRTYVLTGPEALSFADAAAQLSRALGREITYLELMPLVEIEPLEARKNIIRSGVPGWYAEAMLDLLELISTVARGTLTDGVLHLTGREPRSFMQFACDHLYAFRRKAAAMAAPDSALRYDPFRRSQQGLPALPGTSPKGWPETLVSKLFFKLSRPAD